MSDTKIRTLSAAYAAKPKTYARCNFCQEVFIDDVASQGSLKCPNCPQGHTLQRGLEESDLVKPE